MKNKGMHTIGAEYIKLLLESYGCRISAANETTTDHQIEVWSPTGYEQTSALLSTIESDSESIKILVARIINGRRIPVVVEYFLIKECGTEGAWSVDDSVVQQILLDHSYRKIVTDDAGFVYAECPKQLLLDKATKIEERGKPILKNGR